MTGISKRLTRIERDVRPADLDPVEFHISFVRGGHGAPLERTRSFTLAELAESPAERPGIEQREWFPDEASA